MKPEIKKMLILNAPYLIFVYAFDKIGQAFRLAPGLTSRASSYLSGTDFQPPFQMHCRALTLWTC